MWWAPGAIAWWIALLFMVGSLCFAVGALPGYLDLVGVDADNVTFFIGSMFFTGAGVLQYLETANAPGAAIESRRPQRFRLLTWEVRRIDWWASLIQLVGTVFFNVSTFHALASGLTTTEIKHLVWRPDAIGSMCFLVASALAWAEAGHRWVSWRPRRVSWWIALLNLGASVAFGASAFAAKLIGSSGQVRNVELVNLGTFLGAIGFLIGAALLLPERTASTQFAHTDDPRPPKNIRGSQTGRASR